VEKTVTADLSNGESAMSISITHSLLFLKFCEKLANGDNKKKNPTALPLYSS